MGKVTNPILKKAGKNEALLKFNASLKRDCQENFCLSENCSYQQEKT